jgi:uncharacterized protein (DUF3820 family)
MPKLGFGKYGDLELCDVPEDYLIWLIESNARKNKLLQDELARRELAEEADMGWLEKIIKAGYRDLAKRHHPDNGGNTSEMQQLNSAYEALKRARGMS